MLKKSLIMIGLIIMCCNTVSHADDTQKFYDDGYKLMLEFRKCSTIKNQLGQEAATCLGKAENSIKAQLNAFEIKHKMTINARAKYVINLKDASNYLASQKQNCRNLYPTPLQMTFKNQIKSCQVQVDLNRYMYVANSVLGI